MNRHEQIRRWLYPAVLVSAWIVWAIYMTVSARWPLLRELWVMSVTMIAGSIVAGATAEGGAAVAFPVFTKILHIPAGDARTFGLMIQSAGMTAAALVIVLRRVPILPRVVTWVSLGGVLGMFLGTFAIPLPAPYPKLLFTFIAGAFGAALILSRWVLRWQPLATMPGWSARHRWLFAGVGVIGGIFAANTGSGIDMFTFIVLTLAFGIDEKVSTPTTVVIMGLNSVVGFFAHGVVAQDIGVAWEYWLVCVPVVLVGAPLGALISARLQRDSIIIFLLTLIGVELVTTIWLVPLTAPALLVVNGAVLLCALGFALMLCYRHGLLRGISWRRPFLRVRPIFRGWASRVQG